MTYVRRLHQSTTFSYSLDGSVWQLLTVGGSTATAIGRSDATDPLNITGVGSVPALMVRGRAIDYSALIARTFPTRRNAATGDQGAIDESTFASLFAGPTVRNTRW